VIDCFDVPTLDAVIGQRAVAAALVDVVALLGRRADAATVAAEGGAAALRLALIVLEDEEAIITGLELGAGEGLVRRRVAPAGGIAGLQADSVKSTHNLVGVARTAAIRQRICGEALCFLLHILEVIAAGILNLTTRRKALQIRHTERAHIHH